ncbi:MAG: ribosome biogenesis GTP-binding protein YihA/YsxC [Desulfomonilaceae bacterium]
MKIVSAEFIRGAETEKDYPPMHAPEIAFAGRSNVGKSSMINSLLSRKNLVRTSKTPGLTRKINFFLINNSFIFVDLPGYGYASVPMKVRQSWAPMVNTYLTQRDQLAGVVVIVDSRRNPTDLDENLIEFLKFRGIPFVIGLSKADKIGRSEQTALQAALVKKWGTGTAIELFSSVTGLGRKELWSHIIELSEQWRSRPRSRIPTRINLEK